MVLLEDLEKEHAIIDSAFRRFCASRGIYSVEDFLVQDMYELVASAEQVADSERLKEGIAQVLSIMDEMHTPRLNGLDLLKDFQDNKHFLSTGFGGIDFLLQGGFRQGQLTELVGASSSGKTQNVDDLKLKLQYAAIELETVRMEANDQISKHKEEIKQLLNLLKLACQERDEAKHQLQNLATKFMTSCPGSSLVMATRANSSITESNSLSDHTINHHSHVSSSVDSLLEAVTSPEFSSFNMADSSNLGFLNQSNELKQNDPADAVIDNVLKGRALPEQGKLLHTVLEGGPLLQTLLLAGPLPSWRNPPPLQHFKIPPVSIKGCDRKLENTISKSASATTYAKKSLNLVQNADTCRVPAQLCSGSLLGSTKRRRFQ